MSATSQSNHNNRGSLDVSTRDDNNAHSHTQDPTYYYLDGNTVFLIENILFKLHASLIFAPEPVPPVSGDNGQRHPGGIRNLPCQLTDSSDTNPITLPGVTSRQFRNYLFALLGRPSNPEYLALQTDAMDINKHNRALLVRYLDISCLAHRFGMSDLEDWARSQLEMTLKSKSRLARDSWDKDTLLQLSSYTRSTGIRGLVSSTRNLVQYLISTSTDKKVTGQEHGFDDTCVQLYKDPDLPRDDPALFGCIFAFILSLGHRSAAWSKLTPIDRMVLYAAQVQLTAISDELVNVDWLRRPGNSLTFLNIEISCTACKQHIPDIWRETFGQCGNLESRDPLKDVSALARLPQYRRSFISQCYAIHPPPKPRTGHNLEDMMYNLAIRSNTGCPSPVLGEIIREVDRHIKLLYTELACRHQAFASEVSGTTQAS